MRSSKSARRVDRVLRRLVVERLERWAVLGLFLGATGQARSGFFAPLAFDAENGPSSVAVADFNGDGIPDLAVANQNSGSLSVLLGKGDGTYQPAQNYAVGLTAISVAVGDFNGDGHLDLAVANFNDDTVSVLLGIGDGSFQSPQDFPVGSEPRSVAVADLNGDGHLDLVVANLGSGNA